MTSTAKRCKATKHNGHPCQAWAGEGSAFCFWHDPARARERAEARARGGRARHGRPIGTTGNAEPVSVQSMADVVNLLERAVNDALRLENSLQRGRTIATLANAVIKALQFATLEERLEAVEMALRAREVSE